jgi:predicted transglutaminase-like cysteine proteinase
MLVRIAWALACLAVSGPTAHAQNNSKPKPLFIQVGEVARPPIGWVEFCKQSEHKRECEAGPMRPRDIVLSAKVWRDLVRVNTWVNENIRPVTDLDHWGVVEKWSYPDDGRGDCEDYVLLKRRMLMEAGWPRSALLITVVRDKKNEGHSVLTVKSDKGEFILDNQEEDILLWSETGYRFIKRQSQTDQHEWMALPDSEQMKKMARN